MLPKKNHVKIENKIVRMNWTEHFSSQRYRQVELRFEHWTCLSRAYKFSIMMFLVYSLFPWSLKFQFLYRDSRGRKMWPCIVVSWIVDDSRNDDDSLRGANDWGRLETHSRYIYVALFPRLLQTVHQRPLALARYGSDLTPVDLATPASRSYASLISLTFSLPLCLAFTSSFSLRTLSLMGLGTTHVNVHV